MRNRLFRSLKNALRDGHRVALCFALSAGLLPGAAMAQHAAKVNLPSKVLMVYEDSWRENHALVAADTALAQAPSYLNVIALSFAKPDLTYHGNLSLLDVGLSYPFSGEVLHRAIALLKERHPGTKVLLSVGSGAYQNWDHLNATGIADLVRDLGADGVDIDYEPETSCAADASGHIHCPTDDTLIEIATKLRKALPRPMILTLAGCHVGAYGEGAFHDAPPVWSNYKGFMLTFFRSPAAQTLDLVAIEAYDAGTTYDPMQAFQAYRTVWPGRLALGVEVPMKGASGPFYTVAKTTELAKQVSHDPLGAMMVYSMLEPPDPLPATPDHPTGAMLEQAACRGMGMKGCNQAAPLPGR